MTLTLLLLAALQAGPTGEYQYEQGIERPFKLAGLVLAAEALYTHFDSDLDLENGGGWMIQTQLRLGEVYYYRLAGYFWQTEEDLPGGEDVDLSGWTIGLGWDWLFGAFPDFAFDMGGGVGVLRARSDDESDSGFYFQGEAALRWKVLPHMGLRLSGFADFANLHFNTEETEHLLNLTVAAGLEVSF